MTAAKSNYYGQLVCLYHAYSNYDFPRHYHMIHVSFYHSSQLSARLWSLP